MKKAYFFVSATLGAFILLLLTVLLMLAFGQRFSTVRVEGYGRVSYFGTSEEGTVYLKGTTATYSKENSTLIYENGDMYEGELKHYLPNGKGIYTYCDGDVYEGDFVNGAFHGKGKYRFANGDILSGTFVNGTCHGNCQLTINEKGNQQMLVGSFSAWKYTGKLSYYTKDGTYYEGGYLNGLPSGEGRARFPNGDSYEGAFLNGAFSGVGTYTFADGSYYTGQFENGAPHGYGRYTYTENGVETSVAGDFYHGVYLKESES